jgi:hypothetical protein
MILFAAYPFRACRCLRKELRRVIFAFATLIASDLVDFCAGCDAFVTSPTDDIIGMTAQRTGCVLIGPVVGLFVGMRDNALLPSLFER